MKEQSHIWLRDAAEYFWVILAMVGGVSRYLDTYLKSGVWPKIGNLFAQVIVSGFCGYMLAQATMLASPTQYAASVALMGAGVGGFLGTRSLDMISESIRVRLGLRHKHTSEEGHDK